CGCRSSRTLARSRGSGPEPAAPARVLMPLLAPRARYAAGSWSSSRSRLRPRRSRPATDASLRPSSAAMSATGRSRRGGIAAAQPGHLLALAAAAELLLGLVGLGQRLLHHVGRVELAPQTRVELEPGQQVQVVAVLFRGPGGDREGLGHALRLSRKTTTAARP